MKKSIPYIVLVAIVISWMGIIYWAGYNAGMQENNDTVRKSLDLMKTIKAQAKLDKDSAAEWFNWTVENQFNLHQWIADHIDETDVRKVVENGETIRYLEIKCGSKIKLDVDGLPYYTEENLSGILIQTTIPTKPKTTTNEKFFWQHALDSRFNSFPSIMEPDWDCSGTNPIEVPYRY